MARDNGNLIWLGAGRNRTVKAHFVSDDFVVFLSFLIAICLVAECLARALVVWRELEKGVALTFVSTSAFL